MANLSIKGGIAAADKAAIERDIQDRVNYIKGQLSSSGLKGIVFGNSGGKDCLLVAILCSMACDNVTGVIMPAGVKRSYTADREHALIAASRYGIKSVEVDLGSVQAELISAIKAQAEPSAQAVSNIAPRLRMTTLYTLAQSWGCLVAGTGNRSERYLGYFTKHGDGAFDFNPISDLTVTEIYVMLRHLAAPQEIIDKAPSAGLYEGQTDEQDMGMSYFEIDRYLLDGQGEEHVIERIQRMNKSSRHKTDEAQVFRRI